MNEKINNDEKYVLEICGSYRRNKEYSGDIDILLTKKIIIYVIII